MMRKAEAGMTEKLIESVKKHPYLYDPTDVAYKNLAFKTKAWKLIARDINETPDIAKTKWKSLRDNYGRYKKEIANPLVSKKFLRWPWASHLHFLDGSIAERENNKARSSSPPPQQFLEISLAEHDMDTSRDSDVTPPVTPPILIDESSNNAPRSKRLKRDDSSSRESDTELDAVDHLFKSYAKTFKTFSKQNQIALKVELAQLFADVEAKEMNQNLKA